MRLSIRTLDGVVIVSVAGTVDSHAAGDLYDALVRCIGEGSTKLIVDLSGVHIMTRAGARGVIVAAKLMSTGNTEMRICSAPRAVEDFLQSLGFTHLLKCDPTLRSSLAHLSAGEVRDARTPAAAVWCRPPAPAWRLSLYHSAID